MLTILACAGTAHRHHHTHQAFARDLVVEEKFQRVANFALGVNKEIEMIAHSCGVKHPREPRHEHVRLVQAAG